MIRKLMASSAVIALISAGALTMAQAQSNSTDAAKPAVEQAAAAQPSTDANSSTESKKVLTPDQPTLASVFVGRSVYTGQGDDAQNIGDVNDLIVAENGEVTDAVVGVGGFLGIGEKEVAVPFDQLKVEQKDGDIRLIYSATREQLEAAPAFDRTAYDPIARYNEEHAAAMNTSGSPGLASPPAGNGDLTAAPATDQTAATETPPASDQTAAPAASDQIAATETPQASDQTAAPAATDQTTATATPPTADQATTADQNMAAADQPKAGEADTGAANAPASDQTAANAPATDQAPTKDLAATQVAPTGDKEAAASENVTKLATGANGPTFMTPDTQQIRASTLIGQSVYGPGDESIGKVSDLVFRKEGSTRAALVDVGGFLGIGSKTIAIAFKDLSVTPAENGKDMKVSVAMSKEQLDQLPVFEPKAKVAATEPTTGTPAADNMAADNTAAGSAATDNMAAANQPADTTAQPADTTAPATGEQPSDKVAAGTAPVEPAPAGQATADATQPAETEQPAVAAKESGTDVNDMTTGSIAGGNTYELASQDVAASSLIGAAVYGPEDASIGSINDVVFDHTGKIDGVILNVGGFLGLGAKPVAIGFDSLNVRTDENGTLTVMVQASKDQLQSAPTYEEKDTATFQ